MYASSLFLWMYVILFCVNYLLSAFIHVLACNGRIVSIIFFICGIGWWWCVGCCVMLFVSIIPDLWSTLIWELYDSSILFFLFFIQRDSGSVKLMDFCPLFF